METIKIDSIYYKYSWNKFSAYFNDKEYFGDVRYENGEFLLNSFGKDYVLDFSKTSALNYFLQSIIEKYYLSNENLILDIEDLSLNFPFLTLKIFQVSATKYLLKIDSSIEIAGHNITGYYVIYTYYQLRSIKLLYEISNEIVLNLKEQAKERANDLLKEINKLEINE